MYHVSHTNESCTTCDWVVPRVIYKMTRMYNNTRKSNDFFFVFGSVASQEVDAGATKGAIRVVGVYLRHLLCVSALRQCPKP